MCSSLHNPGSGFWNRACSGTFIHRTAPGEEEWAKGINGQPQMQSENDAVMARALFLFKEEKTEENTGEHDLSIIRKGKGNIVTFSTSILRITSLKKRFFSSVRKINVLNNIFLS